MMPISQKTKRERTKPPSSAIKKIDTLKGENQ